MNLEKVINSKGDIFNLAKKYPFEVLEFLKKIQKITSIKKKEATLKKLGFSKKEFEEVIRKMEAGVFLGVV